MTRRERLFAFLGGRFEDLQVEPPEKLCADTSLIRSGLLDSMAILGLAEWIDEEIGAPFDFTGVDLRAEWDTPAGILAFIERREGTGPE